jgi:LPS sulfotransferase NodH
MIKGEPMKKDSAKTKLEKLVGEVKTYVMLRRSVKCTQAFHYLKTEQPPAVHGLAEGPKQFNIVQIQELINHVMTANQLGYETILKASPDRLDVFFRSSIPEVPWVWTYDTFGK